VAPRVFHAQKILKGMTEELLRAEKIAKRFDGVRALRGAFFSVDAGEVHALLGENGAGKSTLAKVLAGVLAPDDGEIYFRGRPVSIRHPLDAQRLGIAIIFQELDLFPHLTVAENVVIGNLALERESFVNSRELEDFCVPFLHQVNLVCRPDAQLGSLPIAQMQLAAIARALSLGARLILMDEPTSSLSEQAVDRLFELVSALKQKGVSVVFVSHKMKEIFRICDRITVLRDGETVGTRVVRNTTVEEIISMMAGRGLGDASAASRAPTTECLLSVKDLTSSRIRGVSFDLHRGEILGVAGLVGSGRSELGMALFGLDRIKSGRVALHGREINVKSPREAIRHGLGFVPEDRKLQGLMMQMSSLENTTIATLRHFRSRGLLNRRKEMRAMLDVQQRTALKAASFDAPARNLSGGNQQKILLGKWLLADPEVLFLDDPTRGIDVAAKQDIYELMNQLAARGKGIIFVSSELAELRQCADRILVLHEGCAMGVLDASRATPEEIMALATAAVVSGHSKVSN
jgi:ribose transport system ATP-binding protein